MFIYVLCADQVVTTPPVPWDLYMANHASSNSRSTFPTLVQYCLFLNNPSVISVYLSIFMCQ